MKALVPVITAAGRSAVLAASNDGLQATITHLAFGSGAYDPAGDETALENEIVRVPIAGGSRVGDFTLHMTGLLDGTEEFWVRECGIILSDGTLLAVYSDPATPLAYKTDGVPIVMAFDLTMAALPADAITVEAGDVSLSIIFSAEFAKLGTAIQDTMRHQIDDLATIRDMQRQIDFLTNRIS